MAKDRTRKVFDRDVVARLWANQSRDYARDSGDRMSFRGTRFFSYATVIGQIVTTENGDRVFLYTGEFYSNTTSKHQCHMRRAIPGYATRFEVPGVGTGTDSGFGDTDRIMGIWARRIRERLEEAYEHPRRGKRLLEEARAIRNQMERFQQCFGLSYRIPVIPDTPTKLAGFRDLAIVANVREILDKAVGRVELLAS